MAYVDGFVLAVPAANKDAYEKVARDAAVVFKDHGALQVVECWGDDVPDGVTTSFPMALKLEAGEVVVFSWITWPSRQARDAGKAAVMDDPRMAMDPAMMPFDGKRMIFGGFEVLVEV